MSIYARKKRDRQAFSLIELVAVVTILGVIAAVVLPRVAYSGVAAKSEMCGQHATEINRAIERYRLDNGDFPQSLDLLHTKDFFPDGIPICPVTQAPFTVDSSTNRILRHTH